MAGRAVDKVEIEEFLFQEAELLDDWRLDDWLTLFHKDGFYWIPIDPDADPIREPSVLYDDQYMREVRVHQLIRETSHWSQIPRSRTVHTISNVRVSATLPGGIVEVRCNLIVTELRSAGPRTLQFGLGEQRGIAARCLYRLIRGGDGWLILLKKVVLINHDQPLDNLTFMI